MAEGAEYPGRKDDSRKAVLSWCVLDHCVCNMLGSGCGLGFAAVIDTHSLPEQLGPAFGCILAVTVLVNAWSRKPWQFCCGLQMLTNIRLSSSACCGLRLEHTWTALIAPEELPAKRVLLLNMPSCLRIAAAVDSDRVTRDNGQRYGLVHVGLAWNGMACSLRQSKCLLLLLTHAHTVSPASDAAATRIV